MSYLQVSDFRIRSTMPGADIDEVELQQAGFTLGVLEEVSQRVDSRLRKRYAAPFLAPVPEVVLGWVARIATPRVYLRRGVNPSDEQFAEIKKDADDAWAEVKEAADSKDGLFDLPLNTNTTATGVSMGGPLSYSEQSPYTWADRQAVDGSAEDGST